MSSSGCSHSRPPKRRSRASRNPTRCGCESRRLRLDGEERLTRPPALVSANDARSRDRRSEEARLLPRLVRVDGGAERLGAAPGRLRANRELTPRGEAGRPRADRRPPPSPPCRADSRSACRSHRSRSRSGSSRRRSRIAAGTEWRVGARSDGRGRRRRQSRAPRRRQPARPSGAARRRRLGSRPPPGCQAPNDRKPIFFECVMSCCTTPSTHGYSSGHHRIRRHAPSARPAAGSAVRMMLFRLTTPGKTMPIPSTGALRRPRVPAQAARPRHRMGRLPPRLAQESAAMPQPGDIPGRDQQPPPSRRRDVSAGALPAAPVRGSRDASSAEDRDPRSVRVLADLGASSSLSGSCAPRLEASESFRALIKSTVPSIALPTC